MNNPVMTVARFSKLVLDAPKKSQDSAPVDRGPADYDFEDLMNALIEQQSSQAGVARNWALAEYGATNSNENIICNPGLALEFEGRQAENVTQWAQSNLTACYTINTEPLMTGDNRIALLIPVANPITDSTTYTRLVSLVVEHIGLDGLSEGAWCRPFKFRPANNAKVVAYTGEERGIIDGHAYVEEFAKAKVFAKEWVGRRTPKFKIPAFIQSLQPHAANAQIDKPHGSDLFTGL